MTAGGVLHGRRILIVEDEFLIARVVAGYLEAAGAEVLGPIGEICEALAFIKHIAHCFDGAVLDVNLRGQKSYSLADALVGRSIPFVFATGYGANALDEAYRHCPRCQKPFSRTMLISAIERSALSF